MSHVPRTRLASIEHASAELAKIPAHQRGYGEAASLEEVISGSLDIEPECWLLARRPQPGDRIQLKAFIGPLALEHIVLRVEYGYFVCGGGSATWIEALPYPLRRHQFEIVGLAGDAASPAKREQS